MNETNIIAELKERLNKDINDIEAAISLGNIYYDLSDAPNSIIYYLHALDLDSALPNVQTDLGAMYWRNDDIGLAEQAFRGAIEHDSCFAQAHINLGLLLRNARSNVEEARTVWQHLITSNPEHALAGKARELLQETASGSS